jgi:two-component system, NarL family, response regulator DevR
MAKIRIVVADDYEVVRRGLRTSLENEVDMTVVGEAGTGAEAVAVCKERQPDVVLLDVRLGEDDGPDVCRRLLQGAPRTAVVMLSNYREDDLVLRSLLAGAKGYLVKDVRLADLKKMIRTVYSGGSVLDPIATRSLISAIADRGELPAARPGHAAQQVQLLSETDLAVLRYAAKGLTNREIGAQVHLSANTVKDHLSKVCEVLEVRSRTEAVAEALRRGLIWPKHNR